MIERWHFDGQDLFKDPQGGLVLYADHKRVVEECERQFQEKVEEVGIEMDRRMEAEERLSELQERVEPLLETVDRVARLWEEDRGASSDGRVLRQALAALSPKGGKGHE